MTLKQFSGQYGCAIFSGINSTPVFRCCFMWPPFTPRGFPNDLAFSGSPLVLFVRSFLNELGGEKQDSSTKGQGKCVGSYSRTTTVVHTHNIILLLILKLFSTHRCRLFHAAEKVKASVKYWLNMSVFLSLQ